MLKRIVGKRTSMEQAAWSAVRMLMPRGRKTRGIQYEVLEYLFEHLYEKVTEDDLRAHLLRVRGHLQQTGDPVKGAINQALKELQRLPEKTFELAKIQEPDASGRMTRYVRLSFVSFDLVMNFREFSEYVTDLLKDESPFLMRTIHYLEPGSVAEPFPGLGSGSLPSDRLSMLVNIGSWPLLRDSALSCRFLPESFANYHFLLVYERADHGVPFLGFVCDWTPGTSLQDTHFILYRGVEKLSKLKFLDRLWHRLHRLAFAPEALAAEAEQAARLARQLTAKGAPLNEMDLLNALLLKREPVRSQAS